MKSCELHLILDAFYYLFLSLQEEVALLSEQVKTMVHMSEFIDFGKLKDAINTLESEKAELQREKDWAIAKADAHEEDIALLHAQIKSLCKETLDEDDGIDHASIHVMNEMNERTASAEEKVIALEQRLHAINELNNINRGQFAMKCLGDAVISVMSDGAWIRNATISRALDLDAHVYANTTLPALQTREPGHVGHITRITLGKLQDEGLVEQNTTQGHRHYRSWRLTEEGKEYRNGDNFPDGIKHVEDLVGDQ